MKSRAVISVTLLGFLVGAAVAHASAPAEGSGFEVEFLDGVKILCSDGGPIDVMTSEIATGELGWSTPDQAVTSFIEDQRRAASNLAIPEELRSHLAPSQSLNYERTEINAQGIAYFDIVSPGSADLEGRLILEEFPNDGWKIVSSYHCLSVLVADFEAFDSAAQAYYEQFETRSDVEDHSR